MQEQEYTRKLTQSSFHDLRPPIHHDTKHTFAGNVLGLGLKFCLQEKHPDHKVFITSTAPNFKRDGRLKYFFAGSESELDKKCDKKIYVKSKW